MVGADDVPGQPVRQFHDDFLPDAGSVVLLPMGAKAGDGIAEFRVQGSVLVEAGMAGFRHHPLFQGEMGRDVMLEDLDLGIDQIVVAISPRQGGKHLEQGPMFGIQPGMPHLVIAIPLQENILSVPEKSGAENIPLEGNINDHV